MTTVAMMVARAARTIEAGFARPSASVLPGGLASVIVWVQPGRVSASKGNGMNRRAFLGRRVFLMRCAIGALGAVVTASAAVAESFQHSVVAQLRGQGYREINVERTMLGRVRIVGAKGGGTREIILNPRTGEILRDIVLAEDGQVMPEIAGQDNSGKGSSEDDGSDNSGSGDDGSGDDGDDDGGSSGHGDGKDGDGHDGDGNGGGEGED
ncbi:MAG: hypothetical protein V4586_19765 [Pseudomonadota bacterium]